MGELDTLELAIAVHRQPPLRRALRQRPLPEGLETALTLLGGHRERLADAAARCGVTPEEMLEATRFFVAEALLHPDADDRRTLGLAPSDGFETAHAHYRALQAWLHPDRNDEAGSTVLAARVNGAWQRLRAMSESGASTPDGKEPHGIESRPRWSRIEAEPPRVPEGRQLGIGLGTALLVAVGLVAWWPFPEPVAPGWRAADGPAPTTRPDGAAAAARPVDKPPLGDTPIQPPPAVPRPHPAAAAAKPIEPPTAPPPPEAGAAAEGPAIAAVEPVASTPPHPPSPTRPPPRPAATPDARRSAHAAMAPDLEKARARSQTLLAFLARRDGLAPPIWANAGALDDAIVIRDALGAGARLQRPRYDRASISVDIGADPGTARLLAGVQPADRSQQPLHLDARLVWRDGAWWIDAVSLELAP